MAGLDRASELEPGHGQLDLRGYVTPIAVGASLDLEARINNAMAGYATAWAEYDRRLRELGYGAGLGLTLRW